MFVFFSHPVEQLIRVLFQKKQCLQIVKLYVKLNHEKSQGRLNLIPICKKGPQLNQGTLEEL